MGMSNESTTYLAILKSRSVREAIIIEYDLIDFYDSENIEWALRDLDDNLDVDLTDEGIIEIAYTDKDPERAAAVVNSLVEKLDRKNTDMSIEQARNTRLFLEERLNRNREDLRAAEENLRRFQETYKAISLPDQVAAAIGEVAKVKSEVVALEVQRNVLQKTMSPASPILMQLENRISELHKQLDKMEFGAETGVGNSLGVADNDELLIPFSRVPSIGIEFARLTRELTIQEAIFQLLTQQYEQAKIQEAKDTPTVQVLDRAVPPLIKSKPIRTLFVLFWGVLTLLVSAVVVFTIEYLARLEVEAPARYEKASKIYEFLKKDMSRLRKGKVKN
jgi:capsule polysaccharide export protein KpsE/RkpR